jgi:lysophospholipase L1-like esterase
MVNNKMLNIQSIFGSNSKIIKIILSWIIVVGFLSVVYNSSFEAQAELEVVPKEYPPTIIMLGDSLTQMGSDVNYAGFVAAMQNQYQRKADILDRGFSGYNTRHILGLFPKILETTPNVLLTSILIGTNDAAFLEKIHIPLEEYETNLISIVKLAQTRGKCIMMSPPPWYTSF